MKSNLKLRQLGCNNEYKKTLSFITERVKVQMNYLWTSPNGTTISPPLVILCINNSSKISSDMSYETNITKVIWTTEQIDVIYTCPNIYT